MKIDWFGVIDIGFAFGIVLALLCWELFALRRSQRRDRERDAEAESVRKVDDPPSH